MGGSRKVSKTGIYQVERGDKVIPAFQVKKIRRIQSPRKIKKARKIKRFRGR